MRLANIPRCQVTSVFVIGNLIRAGISIQELMFTPSADATSKILANLDTMEQHCRALKHAMARCYAFQTVLAQERSK